MHPTNKYRFVYPRLRIIAVILFLSRHFVGATGSDRHTWQGYTAEQKQLVVAGFTDCYRSASPNKEASATSDVIAIIRIIDRASSGEERASFGSLILQSIRKAPIVKPDVHAEHWEGPTGFHSGLWWRGIEDNDRQAYLQGVFWCTQVTNAVTTTLFQSVQQTVKKLDDWYVISDDDWRDPRSNARVDVSVISALEQIEILLIGKARAKQ